MNFAISAMGRCGTLSLANLLNQNNNGIRVIHEIPGERFYTEGDAEEVSRRFIDNYGEVNSFLRRVLDGLKVDKKAVIIRHPHNILLSAVNWRPSHLKNLQAFVEHLHEALFFLDRHIENGIRYVKFEHMITGCQCFVDLVDYLGLNCGTDLPKNNNKHGSCSSINQLDYDLTSLDWFIDKYYQTDRCMSTTQT